MMASKHSTTNTFIVFPKLPSELRLKIWQLASLPRTVTLTYTPSTGSFKSKTSPPTLLSVTRESRYEALRIYTLSFGTSSQPARTYFNPSLDTLYIPRHQDMGYDETLRDFRELVHDPARRLDQVRCVALDHVNAGVKRPWEAYNKAVFLRSFKHPDEIKLIFNADGTGAGDMAPPPHDSTTEGHHQRATEGRVVFDELRIDPERLLQILSYFRQSFKSEERLLEDVCRDSGRAYEAFELPPVKTLAKVLEDEMADAESGSVDGDRAGNGLPAALEAMRS